MRLFKKRDRPEVCGYKDSYGHFFERKQDRDNSEYYYEKSIIDNHYRYKLRNEKAYYFPQMLDIEKDRYIDYILASGTIEKLIEAYTIHNKELEELKIKYNQKY